MGLLGLMGQGKAGRGAAQPTDLGGILCPLGRPPKHKVAPWRRKMLGLISPGVGWGGGAGLW